MLCLTAVLHDCERGSWSLWGASAPSWAVWVQVREMFNFRSSEGATLAPTLRACGDVPAPGSEQGLVPRPHGCPGTFQLLKCIQRPLINSLKLTPHMDCDLNDWGVLRMVLIQPHVLFCRHGVFCPVLVYCYSDTFFPTKTFKMCGLELGDISGALVSKCDALLGGAH